MKKPVISLLFALMLVQYQLSLATEESGTAQLHQIDILQHRASNLAFGELGTDNFHVARAKAWLDIALSEYYEKDTTGFLTASIEQAQMLLDAIEAGQSDISMDTPLEIPGCDAIRPDLLKAISTLKRHEKFVCGQRPIATAEIYLLWAGHKFFEYGQSQAEPHINSVVNLIYDAQVEIENCPVVPTSAKATRIEKITLASDALFAFNKAELNPRALWRLDKLASTVLKLNLLEEVILVGHTDRLRSDGRHELNQRLSEERAESIRQYLVSKGIPAEKIRSSGAGASQPLVNCSTKLTKTQQINCLQPNRRVEIMLRGIKRDLFSDLTAKSKPFNAIQSIPSPAPDISRTGEVVTPIDNDTGQPQSSLEIVTLSGDTLFKFGKTTLDSAALWQLDNLLARISAAARLHEVILVGHTDHMRSDGRTDRNQILSEQRAESIRQYLINKGIPEEKILARGVGASQPVVDCPKNMSRSRQISCLQPNRRVEIILHGVK